MHAVRLLLSVVAALAALALLLPGLLLGAAFWVVGPLTRLWCRLLRPTLLYWKAVIAYQPEVGWQPRPNVRGFGAVHRNGRLVDQFRLTTGPDGWRAAPSLAESEVVVFGDSFAFGHAMDDARCFHAVQHGPRIKPIGANGYNMVQELLWMRRYAPQLGGKLVAWFIYHGNDLFDNLQPNNFQYRTPFVREARGARAGRRGAAWEIVTHHVRRDPWILTNSRRDAARLAEICSPTALAERAYGACEFLIGSGDALCRGVGAQLVVLGIPERLQIDPARHHYLRDRAPDADACDPLLPDRRLAAICTELGVPFVPLHEHLTIADYLEHDVHWNEHGHRKVGRLLGDLYGEHRPSRVRGPRPVTVGV